MARDTQPITTDTYGDETHPAFGMIKASRITTGGGAGNGAVLFDSDITHQHTVRISINRATRKRDLHRDWIHAENRDLIEVELSEAQWASFVSSMNTTGVPATIRHTERAGVTPDLPYDPRLAHSMTEVKEAAARLFEKAQEAMAAYDALDPKAGVKEKRAALARLRSALNNSESNMAFAAKSLTEHAENVVQRARADIEAMVGAEATRLGLTAGQAEGLVALPSMSSES